jgi:hypothetical protein
MGMAVFQWRERKTDVPARCESFEGKGHPR